MTFALFGVRHVHDVHYRSRIAHAETQSFLHSSDQAIPGAAEPGSHQFDHLSGSAALAVPLIEFLPDPVQALRPAPGLSPLRQRRRSGHRAGLLLQYVEVMFEVENLVPAAVVAGMRGDACTVALDADECGPEARRYPQSRPERSRVPVGLYPHTTFAVHYKWIDGLVDAEDVLRQWQ